MEDILLSEEYRVRIDGTSDGTQDKYYKDGIWYKQDRIGGEGVIEALVADLLEENHFATEEYTHYSTCLINGEEGCRSQTFLDLNCEEFITFYRLFRNIDGRDLAEVCRKMDYDDAIEYVLEFMKKYTGLDLQRYMANIFVLDELILNEDRHYNNLGVIFDGKNYRQSPIFDNGKALLLGNRRASKAGTISEKVKCATSKAFSPSFSLNAKYLKKYATLSIHKNNTGFLKNYPIYKELLEYQLNRLGSE